MNQTYCVTQNYSLLAKFDRLDDATELVRLLLLGGQTGPFTVHAAYHNDEALGNIDERPPL